MLVLRFANGLFEPVWYPDLDHVQITVAESTGVEHRGPYYEPSGALRDMVQNHLLQVLALVAMEPPDSLAPEAVRDSKGELLERRQAVLAPDDIVRGQYSAGVVEGREAQSAIGTRRTSRRTRPSRRSWHYAHGSTTTAGTESRSSCAPASASRAGQPRSPSCCANHHTSSSTDWERENVFRPITCCCGSNPTRQSRWRSEPRSPGPD